MAASDKCSAEMSQGRDLQYGKNFFKDTDRASGRLSQASSPSSSCAETEDYGRGPKGSGPALWLAAVATLALILTGFWMEFRHSEIASALNEHILSAFICFALLLVPLWLYGFGAADVVCASVPRRGAKVGAAALCCVPYLVFSLPRHELQWPLALAMAGFPALLAFFLTNPAVDARFGWRDAAVLLAIAVVLELQLLSPAWPYPGLGSLPKLYLADVALYLYLVVRRIEGVGYSFVPSRWSFFIAVREWSFFAPFGIGLGLALRFIAFHPRSPSPLHAAAAVLVTFLLTAVPEELFFRGILQNLLETTRLGRNGALVLTSVLFGLSHFHKSAMFNWRYVLLATIAGIFYGRAWRAERKILTSSLTHTAVDVVWSLWFR